MVVLGLKGTDLFSGGSVAIIVVLLNIHLYFSPFIMLLKSVDLHWF